MVGAFDVFHLQLKRTIDNVTISSNRGHKSHFGVIDAADRHRGCPGVAVFTALALRDPASRIISEFYTNLGFKTTSAITVGHVIALGKLHDRIKNGNITIEEYASWPNTTEISPNYNKAVGMLTYASHVIGQEQLELAMKRIMEYDVIILQERHEESMKLLNCWVHNKTGSHLQHIHQCSNYNPYNHHIPRDTIDEIRKRNALDYKLMEVATTIFDRQVEHFKDKPCFHISLTCPDDMWCGDKTDMRRVYGSQSDLEKKKQNISSKSTICVRTCDVNILHS